MSSASFAATRTGRFPGTVDAGLALANAVTLSGARSSGLLLLLLRLART
jgi:hypothetical protein